MMYKIKNKFINKFKELELYFFLVIFAVLFLMYIYLRFIRQRIPKDIPYSLTDFSFFILVIICIFYIYIIFRLIKPKNPPQFIISIIKKIAYPFSLLATKIIYHPKFYPYYHKFLYKKLLKYLLLKTYSQYFIIVFVIKFLPKIILLIIFVIDIYIFQKIQIFYYFLPLYLFSSIYLFIISNLQIGLEYLTKRLEYKYSRVEITEAENPYDEFFWKDIIKRCGYNEETFKLLSFEDKSKILTCKYPYNFEREHEYDPQPYDMDSDPAFYDIVKHNPNAIYHDQFVSIREYLDIFYKHREIFDIENPENDYYYKADPYCKDYIYLEYKEKHEKMKLTTEDHEELGKEFFELSEIIFSIKSFIELHEYVEKKFKLLPLTISLYVLTLVCWTFILGISLYVFPPTFEYTLIFFNNMLENLMNEEPFSFCNILDSILIPNSKYYPIISER